MSELDNAALRAEVARLAVLLRHAEIDCVILRDRAVEASKEGIDILRQRNALAQQLKAAATVLARHGFCEHAGTWISRAEADRISKDGP